MFSRRIGMTFLELVIGAGILAVALIPILQSFTHAQKNYSTIVGRQIAMNAADEILQQLYIIPFADLKDGSWDLPWDKTDAILDPLCDSTKLFFQPVPEKFSRKLTLIKETTRPLAEAIITLQWSDNQKDTYSERVFLHDLTWSTWLPETYSGGGSP